MVERNNKTERARQFMPFAALKGYDLLLREQEKVDVPRRLPSEEKAAKLSERLNQLRVGLSVGIVHYRANAYLYTQGIVRNIDFLFRKLTVGKETVAFDDIFDLKLI